MAVLTAKWTGNGQGAVRYKIFAAKDRWRVELELSGGFSEAEYRATVTRAGTEAPIKSAKLEHRGEGVFEGSIILGKADLGYSDYVVRSRELTFAAQHHRTESGKTVVEEVLDPIRVLVIPRTQIIYARTVSYLFLAPLLVATLAWIARDEGLSRIGGAITGIYAMLAATGIGAELARRAKVSIFGLPFFGVTMLLSRTAVLALLLVAAWCLSPVWFVRLHNISGRDFAFGGDTVGSGKTTTDYRSRDELAPQALESTLLSQGMCVSGEIPTSTAARCKPEAKHEEIGVWKWLPLSAYVFACKADVDTWEAGQLIRCPDLSDAAKVPCSIPLRGSKCEQLPSVRVEVAGKPILATLGASADAKCSAGHTGDLRLEGVLPWGEAQSPSPATSFDICAHDIERRVVVTLEGRSDREGTAIVERGAGAARLAFPVGPARALQLAVESSAGEVHVSCRSTGNAPLPLALSLIRLALGERAAKSVVVQTEEVRAVSASDAGISTVWACVPTSCTKSPCKSSISIELLEPPALGAPLTIPALLRDSRISITWPGDHAAGRDGGTLLCPRGQGDVSLRAVSIARGLRGRLVMEDPQKRTRSEWTPVETLAGLNATTVGWVCTASDERLDTMVSSVGGEQAQLSRGALSPCCECDAQGAKICDARKREPQAWGPANNWQKNVPLCGDCRVYPRIAR